MSLLLALSNAISLALPAGHCFGIRRAFLRLAGVEVGRDARVAQGVQIHGTPLVTIGGSSWIGYDVRFFSTTSSRIAVGSDCDVAPGVYFCGGSHEIGSSRRRAGKGIGEDIEVGDGTWVCARATILGGAHIGAGSIVAAGALVLRGRYPPNSMLAGVPATVRAMLPIDKVAT